MNGCFVCNKSHNINFRIIGCVDYNRDIDKKISLTIFVFN